MNILNCKIELDKSGYPLIQPDILGKFITYLDKKSGGEYLVVATPFEMSIVNPDTKSVVIENKLYTVDEIIRALENFEEN